MAEDSWAADGGTRSTRRRLLQGAAAAAAASAVPTDALALRRHGRRWASRRVDVAVVGAGLSGLVAAYELVKAGRSVAVLEARDRVGGRVRDVRIAGGEMLELGAQWSGPYVDRAIFALARELGVDSFPTYNTGENVYVANGSRTRWSTSWPFGPIPPDPSAPELAKAAVTLDRMVAEVPIDAPWEAPHAAEWDSQSVETWKLANLSSPSGRALFDAAVRVLVAGHPRDLSLLSLLHYAVGVGNEDHPGRFTTILKVKDGPYERRFVGGPHTIASRLATRLGRRIALKSPVRRLVAGRRYVMVETDRRELRARRVIVALAAPLSARISYTPALPFLRAQLTQRFPQGAGVKFNAVYPHPFWRDDGLTGQALVPGAEVCQVTFDDSPPDAKVGVLQGFAGGDAARHWVRRPAAERRHAVLESLASAFGARARDPQLYLEDTFLTDPWTQGAWTSYTGPGVLLDYGPAIRQPAGPIHWAGTETSTYGRDGMEGAVRSGQRAAKEALAAL